MTTIFSAFVIATQRKFRFDSDRGKLTVEDLWSLPLTGPVSLDTVSRAVNRELKAQQALLEEESFVTEGVTADDSHALKLEILKYIIAQRKADLAERQLAVAKAERKQRLLELLAQKDSERESAMTREELIAAINEL